MPEPTTAAAVGAILVASAAKQLGSRIGDAIADGIFGKKNDHAEVLASLSALHRKVDELLHFSRATYMMVERLPEIVQGIVDQQTLYLAHNDLESNYQAYIRLPEWRGTIGHSTLASVLAAWSIVIDKESSFDRLLEIPRYGEFLLLITNGQLFDAVRNGTNAKLRTVSAALDALIVDQLNPDAAEASRLLGSQYVASGSLLDAAPWLTWTMQPLRTVTQRECVEKPCSFCNGSISTCWDVQVPDAPWNAQRQRTTDALARLAGRLDSHAKRLHALVIVKELLTAYTASQDARAADALSHPHVKVVDSREAYPHVA